MKHISDIKKFNRCSRLYWLSLQQQTNSFIPYVRFDEDLTELVCQKLQVADSFVGQVGDPKEKALEAMEKRTWLINARFEYRDLRVKIPAMQRLGNQWALYFVHVGVSPQRDELYKYSYAVEVLKKQGIAIGSVEVIHFNAGYQRDEKLDPQELFVISSMLYNAKGNPNIHILESLSTKEGTLDKILDEMEKVVEEPRAMRLPRCTRRGKCNFYDECFPYEKEVDSDSILTLVSSQHKHAMAEQGVVSLKEAQLSKLEGTRLQFAQIKASQLGGLYIDYFGLDSWLERIEYPITFLDFEWETFAIPPYEGMYPYGVVPFQYSMHVLQEDGTLEHKEYLGTGDCRLELTKQLMQDIPKYGTVMAFNTDAAEKLRIKELAKQFPEYSRELRKIQKRMRDVAFPFMIGAVYDVRMKGYYSLKTIMSLMEGVEGYETLAINQGMDAVFQWRLLEKQENPELRKQLLDYCKMDTYAMVVIYQWLYKKAIERIESLSKR